MSKNHIAWGTRLKSFSLFENILCCKPYNVLQHFSELFRLLMRTVKNLISTLRYPACLCGHLFADIMYYASAIGWILWNVRWSWICGCLWPHFCMQKHIHICIEKCIWYSNFALRKLGWNHCPEIAATVNQGRITHNIFLNDCFFFFRDQKYRDIMETKVLLQLCKRMQQ